MKRTEPVLSSPLPPQPARPSAPSSAAMNKVNRLRVKGDPLRGRRDASEDRREPLRLCCACVPARTLRKVNERLSREARQEDAGAQPAFAAIGEGQRAALALQEVAGD